MSAFGMMGACSMAFFRAGIRRGCAGTWCISLLISLVIRKPTNEKSDSH